MKKKSYKKIISIILVSTLIFSVLTGVYATELGAALGGFANRVINPNLQAQGEFDYNVEGETAESGGASLESGGYVGAIADYDSEPLPLPTPTPSNSGGMSFMSETTADGDATAPRSISDIGAEEIAAKQAEKLSVLSSKYPTEYEYICSVSEIDDAMRLPLLEMYDYWVISDFEAYAAAFVEDGFAGLEQYHTERRLNESAGGGSGE
jgi:hypothetical protein